MGIQVSLPISAPSVGALRCVGRETQSEFPGLSGRRPIPADFCYARRSGTTLAALSAATVPQYFAHSSISLRLFSNKSPRR